MRRRKIYYQRTYGNPYFRKSRKINKISLKAKLRIAGLIIILGGFFWLLFFHSYFTIGEIEVVGNQRIEERKVIDLVEEQLHKTRLLVLQQKNIFAFQKNGIKERILKEYNINDLKIDKKLPRTIIVSFTEKTVAAVWSENDQYYYIDDSGNVLYKIKTLEVMADNFIILRSKNDEIKIIGNELEKKVEIGREYTNFCLILAKKIKESKLFTIDGIFVINKPELTVEIKISQGPIIYFNFDENLDEQFIKLETLLTEKILTTKNKKGGELEKIEYIDLRFGDKIYYK